MRGKIIELTVENAILCLCSRSQIQILPSELLPCFIRIRHQELRNPWKLLIKLQQTVSAFQFVPSRKTMSNTESSQSSYLGRGTQHTLEGPCVHPMLTLFAVRHNRPPYTSIKKLPPNS